MSPDQANPAAMADRPSIGDAGRPASASAAGPPILEIAELSKHYGSIEALSRVSLAIAQGEFVTLLGPSGSGKTTLLKIISGALGATSGSIRLNGRDITDLPARFRGIGMVFQNFALMPHLSIFDNVAFPLQIRRLPRAQIKARVEEALALVRLTETRDRKPRELSGGQQQRIAIARALVYRPPLILMDEPLGALDKKLRQQMQLEIKRLHRSLGLSMIYVTHDQEEALTMSDRICLMSEGRIMEIGRPEDIYSRPVHAFTADFFGATNIFAGEAVQTGDGFGVADADFGIVKVDPAASPRSGRVGWMVRPELVRLLGPGETDDNVLSGEVEEVILSGQVTQLILKVAGGKRFHATCLTGERADAPSIGASVRFGWNRRATNLLEPSA
jgi:putative spermidine/putrescine transport system ATP-binding protein